MNKKIPILITGMICIFSISTYEIKADIINDTGIIIQSEACTLNGCSVGTYGEGYEGGGYVEFIDEIGDSMTAAFDIEAGLHTLRFRYSQGEYGTNTLSLYINSKFVKQLEFDYTGDWDVSWSDVYVQFADLPEGELSVELRYAEGDGNVDIDYIQCSENGIVAVDGSLYEEFDNRSTVFTSHDGYFDFVVGRDPHLCAHITDYNVSSENVFINNTVEGLRVTSTEIDLSGQNNIHSVTYGGSSLPELCIMGSFSDCSEMEAFTVLPELSDQWRQSYFDNTSTPCECRTSVTASFENCISLKKVDLPACFPSYYTDWGSKIGAYTFKNCSSLPEITLDGYWTIGEGAFVGCTVLDSVILTKEITSIGEYAFGYTENEDGTISRYDGITIYGVPKTAAEAYALENNIPFVSIDVDGDANCDGEFGIADLVFMNGYMLKNNGNVMNSQGADNADYTGDGILNSFDIIKMRSSLIELN